MLADLEARLDPGHADVHGHGVGAAAATARKMASGSAMATVSRVDWGDFKTGTLSSLLTLADTLAKHEAVFSGVTDKIVGKWLPPLVSLMMQLLLLLMHCADLLVYVVYRPQKRSAH